MNAFGFDRIKIQEVQMWKVGEFSTMIIKIQNGSQIKLPEDIMKTLHLSEGQELDIRIEDGQIIVSKVEDIKNEVKKELKHMKEHPEEYKTYSNVDDMFKDMEIDINND